MADMDFPKDLNFLTGIAAFITALAGLIEALRKWRR
jgi:hypothetical protein